MSLPFQVDELIASLNTSHIGNEALELAKLQAQLRQALQTYPQGGPFPTSPVQSAYIHPVAAPMNTPVARSAASSTRGPHTDGSQTRRRRSSSAASVTSGRSRGHSIIREEEDAYWRQSESARYDMDQDVMEDVEEEAQVDALLYSTTNPVQFSKPSTSPSYGSSPTTYAITDPFLAQQLQAAEQRSRQPSFFAQIATAQQHTSPFYAAAQMQSHSSAPNQQSPQVMFQNQGHSARHPLTIDTGPRLMALEASGSIH